MNTTLVPPDLNLSTIASRCFFGVQITELWVLWDAIDMTNVKGRGELRAWIGDDKPCFESEFKDTMLEEELAAIKLLTSRGYTISRN